MADPAQLQSTLDAIKAARNSGVLIVRHGDESTQFRSLAEMDKIIGSLQNEIATAQGRNRSRVSYIKQTSRGY